MTNAEVAGELSTTGEHLAGTVDSVPAIATRCDLAGHLVGGFDSGELQVAIVNPDSMHPVCVMGSTR